MSGIWLGSMDYQTVSDTNRAFDSKIQSARMAELEHQVARLMLLNQALWELLQSRLKLTDAEFEEFVREVDLRDGVEDGKITQEAVKCPQCSRVSNSKHAKCLYCGLEFEKPIFG